MALSDQQVDLLAREAIQRASGGDFVAAENLFARVVDARPNSGQALHLLGQVRLKLGRFADAREPLERASKFLPREVSAQVNYAGCLSVLGEHALALAALDRAARLKPGDAAIAHNRGRALEALDRREEAERAYDEALSVDHRLIPSLSARAGLLAARGDWMGALADLDMALTSRPDDAQLKMRRGELLLAQGDWMRGLPDYEARLDLPGRYKPDLPRWQGEPLAGPLLLYAEQADVESDAALRDTLLLARGIDATVECSETIANALDMLTVRRGVSLAGFVAAAPLRSLPLLLNWELQSVPPLPASPAGEGTVGWFLTDDPPAGLAVERDPTRIGDCRLVVGGDTWPVHLAARRGIKTVMLLPERADWLWGAARGPSSWYPALELIREGDRKALEARLA